MLRKWLGVGALVVGASLTATPVAAQSAVNRAWSPTGVVYQRGASATFAAQTFVPDSRVSFTMFSSRPLELGSATADNEGVARAEVRLPRSVEPGQYAVRASGVGAAGPQNVDLGITVKPTGPPEWKVTGEQFRRYLVAVGVVLACVVVAVMSRRRRKAAANRTDGP